MQRDLEALAEEDREEDEYVQEMQYIRTNGLGMSDAMAVYEDLANERPARRRGRPPTGNNRQRQRTRATGPRRFQASLTVVQEGRDLEEDVWDRFKLFLTTESRRDELFKCYSCLERGGQEGHLHIQSVIDMYSTSTRKIHFDVKRALKDDEGVLPEALAICCRELAGKGLHTWHGMLVSSRRLPFPDSADNPTTIPC